MSVPARPPDGLPLPPGEIYAPEWSKDEFQKMLDAEYFLGEGQGYKGPKASGLTPGKYRLNSKPFPSEIVPVVTVEAQEVGELAGTLAPERRHTACLCHPDDPACNLFPLDQACNVMLSSGGGDCLAEDQCQRYQQGNTGGAQGEVCGCFADNTTIAGDGTSCAAGAGQCSGGLCGEVGSEE